MFWVTVPYWWENCYAVLASFVCVCFRRFCMSLNLLLCNFNFTRQFLLFGSSLAKHPSEANHMCWFFLSSVFLCSASVLNIIWSSIYHGCNYTSGNKICLNVVLNIHLCFSAVMTRPGTRCCRFLGAETVVPIFWLPACVIVVAHWKYGTDQIQDI